MRRVAALLGALLLLATAAPAHASRTQESMFQDDAMLVYPSIGVVGRTLDTLQSLGVDRVRVTVYWRLVAPSPKSDRRPSGFNATDPASYPRENWKRYDDLVRAAYDRGIQVNFDVSGPAPDWASQPPPGSNADLTGVYQPDADEFAQFFQAVAQRYTGDYAPPADKQNPPPPPPRNPDPLPLPVQFGGGGRTPTAPPAPPAPPADKQNPPPPPPRNPDPLPLPVQFGGGGLTATAAQAAAAPPEGTLPRVSYWEDWNEGNQKVFLAPQYVNGREWSPRLYRGFVDGAWRALQATGHGGDTILIGATAPKGGGERDPLANMRPLRFVRALYCVDTRLRPLRGANARALGCPDANQVSAFPAQHPGLFGASGFAHHPYALLTPPALRARNPDDVAMADIPRLDFTLRRIFAAYRQRNRLPIYDTEFGYQTRPPDPFGFRPALAATYINQAEYMSYVNPDIRSYHQFLLEDAPPLPGVSPSDPGYWSSFQTGLQYGDGTAKPTYDAYRIPVFVPGAVRRRPGTFRVWGAVRPAPNGSAQTVDVIFRAGRRGAFRLVRRVRTTSPRNYVDTRLRLSRSGLLRLRWRNPAGGDVELSRTVAIAIRRR